MPTREYPPNCIRVFRSNWLPSAKYLLGRLDFEKPIASVDISLLTASKLCPKARDEATFSQDSTGKVTKVACTIEGREKSTSRSNRLWSLGYRTSRSLQVRSVGTRPENPSRHAAW